MKTFSPLTLICSAAFFSVLCLASVSASAYSGYIGGGFHMGKYQFNATYDDWNPIGESDDPIQDRFNATGSGIMLKIGQYISPSFAVEAHYVAGLGGDSFSHSKINTGASTPTGYDSDADFNAAWGIFAKPMGFLSESNKVYGLIGYGGVDFDIDNDDASYDNLSPSSSFAFGLGFESEVEYGIFLGAEYVAYLYHGDGAYNSFNVTLSAYVW